MVEYSIQCLKNLAVDEVSVEEMIDEGVLDVLNDVLKVNPYNEAIQQQVNAALIAFCKNEYLARMVAERFGMHSLVFSLKKHVESVCDLFFVFFSPPRYLMIGVSSPLSLQLAMLSPR